VVVTDGLPNPSTPADALAVADRVKASGTAIDVIGIGLDVDPDLLRALASSPDRYHYAPDAEDLHEIFSDLVWEPLPCGGMPTWPYR
jgi:hypothetical protein